MRPRLKKSIEQIETPDGDLILMRTSSDDIRIESPGPGDRELLAALDGTSSELELEQRFGREAIEATLKQMCDLELLEDAGDDELIPVGVRRRFDRQLRYFSDLGGRGSPAPSQCQARLGEARVAVIGVGGLGGRCALELACCGVGELWLIDGDRVEESNLNRQIQFEEADVGQLKVEATASRLLKFNSALKVRSSATRIESQEELRVAIEGADLVIDAADWPAHEIESWCNAACFEAGIPYLSMSHYPPIARCGPLYVPGSTGCFECQQAAFRREYPLYDAAIEQRRGEPSTASTLGPACGIVGGFVAAEAMHFLTGLIAPPMLGAGYICDLRSMEMERFEVTADPGCPICSGLP